MRSVQKLAFPRLKVVVAFACLAVAVSVGCSERGETTPVSGELGADPEKEADQLQLADWQPLGTIISSDPRHGVVTILIDLWITKLPEGSEIATRAPDGVYSATLGEPILKRRRVHTYSISSGNPTPGDLVFYRQPK